jgi:hypothetical protein
LRHWASRADRNWHIIQAAELKKAQRVCCGKIRGDIAVDAPYGNQFGIWPSGEKEHRDRIVNANIRVEENLGALHLRSLCRVRALRVEAFQDHRRGALWSISECVAWAKIPLGKRALPCLINCRA